MVRRYLIMEIPRYARNDEYSLLPLLLYTLRHSEGAHATEESLLSLFVTDLIQPYIVAKKWRTHWSAITHNS